MLTHKVIDFDSSQQRQQVLTKAVLNAADFMGLRQVVLARALGVSESSISRMRTGDYLLRERGKEWELASLLVRLYRGLDSIMAGDETALRSWLQGYNTALGEVPAKLIASVAGLSRTVEYVDAYRARV